MITKIVIQIFTSMVYNKFIMSLQDIEDLPEDILPNQEGHIEDTKKMEEKRLDESLSAITEWKGAERSRLESEKDGLLASIDANRSTDTFWENIFG